jgi:hypothetical protein
MDKKKRITYICLFLAAIIMIAPFGIKEFVRSRIGTCEGTASSRLRTYNGMLVTFRHGNYQARGRKYPQGSGPETNSGKFCALYYETNNSGDRVTLIGIADAKADCRADGDTDAIEEDGFYIPCIRTTGATVYQSPVTVPMRAKAGHWVGLMEFYFDGKKKIPYDDEYSKDHYALVVFPDEYGSTGERTYIINETGRVYSKDCGKGEYIDTYPGPDPTEHGWFDEDAEEERADRKARLISMVFTSVTIAGMIIFVFSVTFLMLCYRSQNKIEDK